VATPFRDRTPTRRLPIVTWLLIGTCVFVYVFLQAPAFQRVFFANDQSRGQAVVEAENYVYRWSVIPCEVTSGKTVSQGAKECHGRLPWYVDEGRKNVWASVAISMFLHGGLLHIAGNMLFLWVFGRVVEDRLGHLVYLGVYLIGGLVATFTFAYAHYHSTTPGLGASGAIAAVMGVAVVLNPNGKLLTVLQTAGAQVAYLPAWSVLGLFFASQFFYGDNTVAWEAHVGGMVFGALFGVGLLLVRRLRGPAGPAAVAPPPPALVSG
jgi:membrane associated rhomboid family serine protease